MLESARLILPEIVLGSAALILLVADVLFKEKLKKAILWISYISLLLVTCLLFKHPGHGLSFGMLVTDPFSVFFKLLAVLSAFFIFLISEKDSQLFGENAGTYASLVLFSVVGMMILSSTNDLLALFIGMELTTVPLFILSGFLKGDMRSSEGAIKFFLVGAFSTGLMLFGISYLYGLAGSTQFSKIFEWYINSKMANGDGILFGLSILFLFVGLGFKLSLVPFHQWTPDAYQGSPTPITAFFSASREAGVIVVTLRFFADYLKHNEIGLAPFFMLLSMVTMTVGNLTALKQDNLKRLLAFSSIAHAGTILIGLAAGNVLGREGIMLYSFAYFLMSLGAFTVVIYISRLKGSDDISSVQGLARENFPVALLMLFFLLSLSGIPPFLGFWGKFYVFWAAIEANHFLLVAVGLLNAVVAVYYYFRIVHKIFFQEPAVSYEAAQRLERQHSLEITTLVTASALLLFGLFPQTLLSWIKGAATLP